MIPENNFYAETISTETQLCQNCLEDFFYRDSISKIPPKDSIEIIIGTYLGNNQRNYYGNTAPNNLNIHWKLYLGSGKTLVSVKKGPQTWFGAGWTGQPLIVKEKDELFLIHGAFDHKLRKINARTGDVIWEYKYDDVIKGTGTLWMNKDSCNPAEKLIIMQGSRKGLFARLSDKIVPSFRGIEYFTGQESWWMDIPRTASYSRDVDASPCILNDTCYIGLENGTFASYTPIPEKNENQKKPLNILQLYTTSDYKTHFGNLVTEASPCVLGSKIYIAAGSGHIYGYNTETKKLDWDFQIGSDIDGTPVATHDSCLIVAIEKQYISGQGGVIKIDPRKKPDECVVWFFPTGNRRFATWEGGIIGSCSLNNRYKPDSCASLCSFIGIDGKLYVVNSDSLTNKYNFGPNKKNKYPEPLLVFSHITGPSISTPIFTKDKLIAAGYNGLYLFEYDNQMNFTLKEKNDGVFESTPVVNDSLLYISSRDGYLYCYGKKSETIPADQNTYKTQITESKSPDNKLPYKIVAGSFKTIDRAKVFNNILVSKGLDSRILGPSNGYYYNIIGDFETLNESTREILRLNGEGISQVWVLHSNEN